MIGKKINKKQTFSLTTYKMSQIQKKTRCPNGSKRNKKTGECEQNKTKKNKPTLNITSQVPIISEKPNNETPNNKVSVNENKVPIIPNVSEYQENKYTDNEEKQHIENKDIQYFKENPSKNPNLYPNINDPLFNVKIATKKEFFDLKYDGSIDPTQTIEEKANELSNAVFELATHQVFVRNFLSFQTPYNGLLLYHGLGSGKTLSAILVCEEMREYLKQIGINKKILVIASPNVQDNFKLQLFDDKKLKIVQGIWTIGTPTGSALLKECFNSMSIKATEITKEKLVHQVHILINKYYTFKGYDSLSNYIEKVALQNNSDGDPDKATENLDKEFNNRLVVIDEIHNIKIAEDVVDTSDIQNKKKAKNIIAIRLMKLVESAKNMRLLLLSATPMYNSYKEIIYLLNLLNRNDQRATVKESMIFDKSGNFKEGGEELLIQKARGYISFVRGENPFTFPYRIYPKLFAPEHSLLNKSYPIEQMNGKELDKDNRIKYIDVYTNPIGDVQEMGYQYIIDFLKQKNMSFTTKKGELREMPDFEELESFGYTLLQTPLQALNIVYPLDSLSSVVLNQRVLENENTLFEPKILTGKYGLERIMTSKEKGSYKYKDSSNPIFSPEKIGQYSSKIKNIHDSLINSEGIVLIYSQYIEGGIIPIALMLEEMGFKRYEGGKQNNKSLFEKSPTTTALNAITMKPRIKGEPFSQATYIMITGDSFLSVDNNEEVKAVTDTKNVMGHQIKVILISQAGSEGLDFKFVRQVHIMEPWYNMNRIEQIIGRGVRNLSHKDLPFSNRNVEIFMYGTLLTGDNKIKESADLYVYRLAEINAEKIGKITRILKQVAVDCLLNHEQTKFSQINFEKVLQKNSNVLQVLSNGKQLKDYSVGDVPFTATCDYMQTCDYQCVPTVDLKHKIIKTNTYHENFIQFNSDKIIQKIKGMFSNKTDGHFLYKKKEIMEHVNRPKKYPLTQIYFALTLLIEDKNEFIEDRYGRPGHLVNIGEFYLFQPIELSQSNLSLFERSVPIDFKYPEIVFEFKKDILRETENKQEKGKEKEEKEEKEKGKEEEKEEFIKILMDIQTKISLIRSEKESDSDDSEWYTQCRQIIKEIESRSLHQISTKDFDSLATDHYLDFINFNKKILLLNELDETNNWKNVDHNVLKNVKSYFKRKHQIQGKTVFIVFYHFKKQVVMILKGDKKWKLAEKYDLLNLNLDNTNKKPLNKIVGFIGMKNNQVQEETPLTFKTKLTGEKRNKGSECITAGKKTQLSLLNIALGEEIYSNINTNNIKKALCVYLELVLRYLQEFKKDFVYFLDVDETQQYEF